MHCPARDRVGVFPLLECELQSFEDPAIDDALDIRELLWAQRSMMSEIESQPIRVNERARLMHVLAKYLPERGMKKVCRRVIAFGIPASIARDGRPRLPELHGA